MKTLREEALEKTKELLLNYEIQQDTILFNGAHIADLSKDELLNHLKNAARILESTRPTAVNLFWATSRILRVAEEIGDDTESTIDTVINEAKKMADEDFETNLKIGKNGAELLEDKDVVLTHCKWSK